MKPLPQLICLVPRRQSTISARRPNLSAPVAESDDFKPRATLQNIASASALVAEIQTSLAERMCVCPNRSFIVY